MENCGCNTEYTTALHLIQYWHSESEREINSFSWKIYSYNEDETIELKRVRERVAKRVTTLSNGT